jgi:hypothetical protein
MIAQARRTTEKWRTKWGGRILVVECGAGGPDLEVRVVVGGGPPHLPKPPAHSVLHDALADRTYQEYLCVSEDRVLVWDLHLL